MKRRTASDRMAECIIEMVHEYKQQIEYLHHRIDILKAACQENEKQRIKAVEQSNYMSDTLGEIADIIAGITEHTDDGADIRIYLSDIQPEGERKLKRLFKLLDIPMTAEQIKEGDTIEED